LNFSLALSGSVSLIRIIETQQGTDTMTYYESAIGVTITKARAYKEFQKHDATCDWVEFVAWAGDKETYLAEDVLGWLGY
jgi:hypothetical protein